MESSREQAPRILSAAWHFWSDRRSRAGFLFATREFFAAIWEFLRDSTPSRLRSRFGDADYDWDFRVNTTSGAVGWRDRLLGVFYSLYQPTEPASFREMIEVFEQSADANLRDFAFIDLGSGKGRTLLMASEYPFRRIIGVELLPSLHRIAQENIAKYKNESQRCFAVQSVCGDATNFQLPEGPLLIYLFNPFPEAGIRSTIDNLRNALESDPRAAYVVYHNAQHEELLLASGFLRKIAGTHQYSIFVARH